MARLPSWLRVLICWCFNFCIATVLVTAAIAVLWFDLSLGPDFMSAYAESRTKGDNWWLSEALPWILSVATTGFQYYLYKATKDRRFQQSSIGGQVAYIVGVLIAVADVVTDVGGMTQRYTDDPAQAINILPDNPDPVWWIVAGVVVIACGLQEFILLPILHAAGREAATHPLPGAFFIKGAVWGADQFFKGVRYIAMFAAAMSAIGLNLSSSVHFIREWVVTTSESALMTDKALLMAVGGAIIVMFFQLGFVWVIRHNGANFKSVSSILWMVGVGAVAILGAFLNVGGFTVLMYGPHQEWLVVPDDPALAWLLLAWIVLALCTCSEPLVRVVFDDRPGAGGQGFMKLGRKKKSGPGSGSGGGPVSMPPRPQMPPLPTHNP